MVGMSSDDGEAMVRLYEAYADAIHAYALRRSERETADEVTARDFCKAQALVRLGRFMRPGAVLRLCDVAYSFQPGEAEERIERWCATGGSDIETDWSRAELEEHVRDEHSTFTWLLEPIIERAGFRIEDADYSPDGIFARYVARRR
jgi:hypothetical protein